MRAVDWAFTVPDLNATKRLLLVGLAWLTDDQGVTIKGQKAIAKRLGQDDRWVREHLPGLAQAGLLTRYRRHRLDGGHTTDLIVLNMPRDEPLDLSAYSGIVGEREAGDADPSGGNPSSGGNPPSPPAENDGATGGNPPDVKNLLGKPPTGRGGNAREEMADAFPSELPDAFHEVAMQAGKILKRTALERGQRREVTRAAVGHAVLTFLDRDHVKVARDVEAYLLHGRGATKSCADIVSRYRNFLENSDPRPGAPLAAPKSAAQPSASSATIREMAAELRSQGQ